MCVFTYLPMEVCVLDMHIGYKVSRNLTYKVSRKGKETFSYLWFYVDNLKFVIAETTLKNILDLKNYTRKINLLYKL